MIRVAAARQSWVANRSAEVPSASTSSDYRRVAVFLAISDGLCLVTAVTIAYVARFGWNSVGWGYFGIAGLAPALWVASFLGYRLYQIPHLAAWDEFRRVLSGGSVALVLIVMTSYWAKADLSRIWVGLTWVLGLTLTLAARRVWRWYLARLRTAGRLSYRTLIIGTNDEAASVGHTLTNPVHGFSPQGYVAVEERPGRFNGLPVVGALDDITTLIKEHSVECLFLASSALRPQHVAAVIKEARRGGIEVRVSANIPEILSKRILVQPYGNSLALALSPVHLTGSQAVVKRGFDIVASVLGLIVLAPVLAVITIMIKVSSKGPVLFRQERITKDGRPFEMLKFRTMRIDADRIVEERGIDTSAPFFKLQDDPRLTPVGGFLRRFSLDELPQFFNVVIGDMSLVGPRPLPADQVAVNPELLGPRHEVRAGITGWWQIHGRSEVSPQEAVKMDLFYIENWSLTLDLYVLLKTARLPGGVGPRRDRARGEGARQARVLPARRGPDVRGRGRVRDDLGAPGGRAPRQLLAGGLASRGSLRVGPP